MKEIKFEDIFNDKKRDLVKQAIRKHMTIQQWESISPQEEKDVREQIQYLTPFKTASSLHIFEEQYKIDEFIYRVLFAAGDTEGMIEKYINSFEI